MRVAITGSSGLIGTALVTHLRDEGHEVVRVVRSGGDARADTVRWDPEAGTIDAAGLAGAEGIVHLAGEALGEKRWSDEQKRRIRESRTKGTALLATALAGLDPRPSVLVSGSGVGYYGLRGDEVLTEASSNGGGFLAELCRDWEEAAQPAVDAGIRTVFLRTGIVLSAKGGALGKLLPLVKLGLGGKLASGRQWWSWISLEDEARMILHALTTPSVSGPMNAVAPNPVTNAELVKEAGKIARRPTVLAVPKFALGLVMGGELTEEMILASQRAQPTVATASGFTFTHPDVRSALRAILGK